MSKVTTVSLPKKLWDWIKKKNISLSRYLQSKIKEDMEKEAKTK